MKKILFVCLSVGIYQANGQQFPIDTIRFHGESDNKINLVFLSDGYTSEELDKYISDVVNVSDELFGQTPFSEYSSYFNVIAIKIPSQVSGAATNPDQPINNYFGSTFGFAGIDRLLVPLNTGKVNQVLADNFPTYDQPFMMVNSDTYGGSGGPVATASTNESSAEIAIHEIGHSIAALADEYWIDTQFESPNKTMESNANLIKWKNWLDTEGISIVAHDNPVWFKPHERCKMQVLGMNFCAVCRETLVDSFYDLVSLVESFSPVEQVKSGTNNLVSFSLELQQPDPDHIVTTWVLNDSLPINADHSIILDLDTLLEAGKNSLTVQVVDDTPFNRKDLTETEVVEWEINLNGSTTEIFGTSRLEIIGEPAVVTFIDDDQVASLEAKIFPNPAQEYVDIQFKDLSSGQVVLKVIDLKGKVHIILKTGKEVDILRFPISHLSSGVYILHGEVDQSVFTRRFIKE